MGHVKQKLKRPSAHAGYRRLAYFQTKSMLYWFQKIPFLLWLSFFTLFKAGFLPKQRNENWKTAGMYTSTSATNTVKIIKEITIWLAEVMIIISNMSHSDFVSNSYCEFCDSSCEKSWVQSRTNESAFKKKRRVRNWKCLGLCVTSQFIFKAQQRLKGICILKWQPL